MKHSIQQMGSKLTINRVLRMLGVEWDEVYRGPNALQLVNRGELLHHCGSFWMRNEGRLDELAYEVHRAYLRKAKAVRPDLTENHEEAVELGKAYDFVRRALKVRGVMI